MVETYVLHVKDEVGEAQFIIGGTKISGRQSFFPAWKLAGDVPELSIDNVLKVYAHPSENEILPDHVKIEDKEYGVLGVIKTGALSLPIDPSTMDEIYRKLAEEVAVPDQTALQ